jgi:hypothetical protein
MKRWTAWISWLIVLSLVIGCSNAADYVKNQYPLVDVQGKGKDTAKIYLAENKDVPTTAKEIASREKPEEISKESKDQMFLVYSNKLINLQKDPDHEANTFIEIDSIDYAKNHYSSSFLEGYLTASLLQSLFGGGWYNHSPPAGGYRGYASPGTYTSGTSSGSSAQKPSTSDRSGSFTSKNGKSPAGTSGDSGGSSTGGLFQTRPSTSGSTGSFTTGRSGTGSSAGTSIRKNDGSTPSYKISKPSTSSRSGSFSSKRRR